MRPSPERLNLIQRAAVWTLVASRLFGIWAFTCGRAVLAPETIALLAALHIGATGAAGLTLSHDLSPFRDCLMSGLTPKLSRGV